MTTWKIIQIYKVPAETKRDALDAFHQREQEGMYFTAEFAVEDKPEGFWRQLLKQVTG